MYLGLIDADARLAEHRYRQVMSEAQHRRFVAGARSARDDTRPGRGAIRQYLARLVRGWDGQSSSIGGRGACPTG